MSDKIIHIDTINKNISLVGGVPVEISHQENGQYLIECPDLDVATWSDTQEGCFSEMQDLLKGLFETLIDLGTLHEVMAECGWKVIEDDYEVKIIPPFVIKTFLNYNSQPSNATVSSYQN
jgi:predicted RNase H-like HicB family nuclease